MVNASSLALLSLLLHLVTEALLVTMWKGLSPKVYYQRQLSLEELEGMLRSLGTEDVLQNGLRNFTLALFVPASRVALLYHKLFSSNMHVPSLPKNWGRDMWVSEF